LALLGFPVLPVANFPNITKMMLNVLPVHAILAQDDLFFSFFLLLSGVNMFCRERQFKFAA